DVDVKFRCARRDVRAGGHQMLVLLADGGVVAAAALQPQPGLHAAGTAGRELPGERGRAQQETGPAGVNAVLEDLGIEHPDADDLKIHAPAGRDAWSLLRAV